MSGSDMWRASSSAALVFVAAHLVSQTPLVRSAAEMENGLRLQHDMMRALGDVPEMDRSRLIIVGRTREATVIESAFDDARPAGVEALVILIVSNWGDATLLIRGIPYPAGASRDTSIPNDRGRTSLVAQLWSPIVAERHDARLRELGVEVVEKPSVDYFTTYYMQAGKAAELLPRYLAFASDEGPWRGQKRLLLEVPEVAPGRGFDPDDWRTPR